MNRSAALAAAYLLLREQLPLTEVVERLVDGRGPVLRNTGFLMQAPPAPKTKRNMTRKLAGREAGAHAGPPALSALASVAHGIHHGVTVLSGFLGAGKTSVLRQVRPPLEPTAGSELVRHVVRDALHAVVFKT